VQVDDEGKVVKQFRGTALVAHPVASLSTLIRGWKKKLLTVPAALLKAQDALPKSVLQALIILDRLRQQTKQDPLGYLTPGTLQLPSVESLKGMGYTAAALS
jgi:hypothetical protein